MPPNVSGVINKDESKDGDFFSVPAENTWKEIEQENESEEANGNAVEKKLEPSHYFGAKLKWLNIISIAILHIWAIHSLVTYPFPQKKLLVLYSEYLNITLDTD